MTQPVQEPTQGRTDQGQEFRTRQLFRRPAPAKLPGTQLDFVSETYVSNLVITTTTQASATTIISSNPVVYDGSTQIRLEWYTPDIRMVSLTDGGINDLGGFVNLWMDSTDLGIMRYMDSGTWDPNTSEFAMPGTEVMYLTPSAGTHTFTLRGWCQQANCEMRIIATSGRLVSTLVITSTGA